MSKVGRNYPCPCGSGKKYKHCHGMILTDAPVPAGSFAQGIPQPFALSIAQLMQTAYELHSANRLAEAEPIYREVLARAPQHTQATHMLGVLEHQNGRNQQAVALIGGVIEATGGDALMHNNLAEALSALQRIDEAIVHYRQATELDPAYADAFNNLGVALTRAGQFDKAETALLRAIEFNANAVNPHTNLGNLYQMLDRYEDAVLEYQRALAIDATDAETHNNIGNAFKALGRLKEAISHYKLALTANPRYVVAANNHAVSLQLAGYLDEALRTFDYALKLAPLSPDVLANRSMANHLAGNIAKAWDDYEHRFLRTADRPERRHSNFALWRGALRAGESLLVWGEQGVGDEIWAGGMIPDLVEGRAKQARVVLECAPKLATLLRRSFPGVEIVERKDVPDARIAAGIDFQIAGSGLARFLRPDLNSFPARDRYLLADPGRERYWKTRLAESAPGLNVGISWRSSNTKGARALSCTKLEQWGAIFALPGVRFVNVQYDECEAELAAAEAMFGIRIHRYPEVDMFDDLDETAALMRGLDLVIAPPTSVAIMSAALGVKTWQIHYCADWRCHGQDYNPWFPTMKEYIRRWDDTREQVLGRIAVDLAALAGDGRVVHDKP